jgi:hypothetical protein
MAEDHEFNLNNERPNRPDFASRVTRGALGRGYVTDRDLAISRGDVKLVAEANRKCVGTGSGIRAWRAESVRKAGAQ